MRRKIEKDSLRDGNDSFLDVVANMVGILIILVMVVGVRAARAPVAAAKSGGDKQPVAYDLASMARTAQGLEHDVFKLALVTEEVRRQTVVHSVERGELAFLVMDRRHELDEERSTLALAEQEALNLRREVSQLTSALEQTQSELGRTEPAPKDVVRIENYPTPLARPVDNREVHFQLRGGRITYIPIDDLLEMLKQSAQQRMRQLRSSPEVTGVVGPVGGFRMHYTLERVVVTGSPNGKSSATRTYGAYARLGGWDLLPISSQLGEPLDAALAPDSQFRAATARLDPKRATITLWTYPDSFAEYRTLRKELYRMGYAVAGRPLPHRFPIGGSPRGTKSAAE